MTIAGRTAAVIGGGPAGLMAAEVLASAGLIVTVFEHMPSVGRKLLLAGRGGLNITHSEPFDRVLARYDDGGPPLTIALHGFTPADLRAWCAELGEPTFIGTSGRVFPQAFRATPLLRAWLRRLDELGVTIMTRHRFAGFTALADGTRRCLSFVRADGTTHVVAPDVTVLALGGASWPRVGSDGSWVESLCGLGVRVTPLAPSNCGVRVGWSPVFSARFAGVPVKNVAIGVENGPRSPVRGDAMITAHGLEGGPVYASSSAIRSAIDRAGGCTIRIDLQPDLDVIRVGERLARRRPKDSLGNHLRRALGLSPASVALMREATGNDIPDDPHGLASLVKSLPIAVTSTMPIDRAISTAGGVHFDEIDERFMLRRSPGTFVAGEMLDWDAPTGGYLLQASFSTGVAAARGAIDWLESAAEREGGNR